MSKIPLSFDVIVLGAGAAGLMCAIEAGKRGKSVLVLEHNASVGKKIRISGGGRCNFTNIHTTPKNYLSANEHFAKSALARFTPTDFCKLVQKYEIPFHEKKLGQLFCDHSAQDIIELLKKECALYHVRILLEASVNQVSTKSPFVIASSKGTFDASSVVVATGGLSIPSLGTSDLGYCIAKQFNMRINPCRPGLVPLTFPPKDVEIYKPLAGVALDTLVSFKKVSFRENTLFTHKGLSGPAILQISSYWQPKEPITINFIPDHDMAEILKKTSAQTTLLKNFLKNYLPSRLADTLCDHFLSNKPINTLSPKEIQGIANKLHHWEFVPNGTEGYLKAEVTVGGIDTDELSSKTMESKKIKGLFFIGEVVDVTGHLGGFNFQWAWGSGFAAGQYV